ncbi:hypothetical protein [Absidia glauca]|uniref:Uncharacterized protein n=1 Tax=Absidia glauca TaxID=4829 RepID=A0A168KP75_ABSGL|nr:hypothetical protein [Absidia glauca]
MATHLFTLILYFVAIIAVGFCFTDNASLPSSSLPQQQEQDSLSLVISSRLAAIPVPSSLTGLSLNNDKSNDRLIAKDHNPLALIGKSTSRVCGNARGEKRTAACSLLLSDRPWRTWKQQLSQVFSTNKRRISTIAHNWFVKNAVNGAMDTLETVQWKVHDWHHSPSLEWYLLKSQWTSFAYQCMDKYLDPELNDRIHNWINNISLNRFSIDSGLSSSTTSTTSTASTASTATSSTSSTSSTSTSSNKIDSDATTLGSNEGVVRYHGHRTKHVNLNHNDLEPDNEGCYHDVFGTTLCVGQQSELDGDELKDRMDALFKSMSYEDRTHTLRFQHRFLQWATKASTLTSRAVDQAQSIWLQYSQEAYQFLDDAFDLAPSCTNNHPTNPARPSIASASEMTSHHVVFPFSVSPHDKSLESSTSSLGQVLSRARSPPPCALLPRSLLSLKPAKQEQWTACSHSDPNYKRNDDGTTVPRAIRAARSKHCRTLLSQPLDPYNQQQYHYLLAQLEKKMTKRLVRMEKEALQEYYRAMASAPHDWKTNFDRHPQQQHDQQEQRPGYATQQTYQQLRLYTTLSFRKLYMKSTEQLVDASRRYDALAMEQVIDVRKEWRWVERQRRSNHHYQQYRQYRQEQQQQQSFNRNTDVNYSARCQQWWRRNETWRLVRLVSSGVKQLGYWYNKDYAITMRDDGHTLLSSIASFFPPSHENPPRPPTDTRAAVYIGQTADNTLQTHRQLLRQHWGATFEKMDQRSRSMWVSAMDEKPGRLQILPSSLSLDTTTDPFGTAGQLSPSSFRSALQLD